MEKLTQNAIEKLIKIQFGKDENIIVDILKLIKTVDEYKVFELTDGKSKMKGIVEIKVINKDVDDYFKLEKEDPLRIRIKQHITHYRLDKPSVIEILDFMVIKNSSKCPQSLAAKKNPILAKLQQKSTLKVENFIKRQFCDLKQTNQKAKTLAIQRDQEQSQTKDSQLPDFDIKSFEKISDLYESFHGWELLIRVTEASYRQFTSKIGKMTKILSMELIDRTGSVITGKMFGEVAQARQKTIQKGKVYRVSRGRVVQDKFVNQINKNSSKYTIIFNADSQFLQVKDVPAIPTTTTKWITLNEIPNLTSNQESYHFVGVLIEIGDEVTLEKEGKNITFQHFKIGDPISRKSYQGTIWNRQLTIKQELIGKSIIIKNFRVSEYKGQTTLTSTFISEISQHDHLEKFQGKIEGFHSKVDNDTIKTISQLGNELQTKDKPQIRTTVEVWVSSINFDQKWFYEACPKCKKSCTPNSKCLSCSKQVSETIKCFKIIFQLADYTGCIKALAFNEATTIIFEGAEVQSLEKMENKSLFQYGQRFYYNQYRMQIVSKIDHFGRINHSIAGKPTLVNVSQSAERNLREISEWIKKPINSMIAAD